MSFNIWKSYLYSMVVGQDEFLKYFVPGQEVITTPSNKFRSGQAFLILADNSAEDRTFENESMPGE